MSALLSQIFPILYGLCLLFLLWQAFRVMGQGFQAARSPGSSMGAGAAPDTAPPGDRTGKLTIHPELLDEEGQLTSEDLLTVRFGGGQDSSPSPGDPG